MSTPPAPCDPLPARVDAYLQAVCLHARSPAFVAAAPDGKVLEAGGALAAHGLHEIRPGPAAEQALPFLLGLLPLRRDVEVVEGLELSPGRYTDVHLLHDERRDWVVLLDATPESGRRQQLQQTRNELVLLRDELTRRNAELDRANAQLRAANDRISRDLGAAAEIQRSLLPTAAPDVPGAEFAWRFQPCDELAGDTLSVLALDNEHVAFYVIDVSGHGVPAALLSVTLSRVLSPAFEPESLVRNGARKPSEVAADLNRRFPVDRAAGQDQYFTLLYGVLNTSSRELRHVSAGACWPVLVTADGDTTTLEGSDLPVGWVPHADFTDRVRRLREGDRVYVYSDGLIEAMGGGGEQFGGARLEETLAASRSQPLPDSLDTVLRRVADWCGADWQDDVTLLALELSGA